MERTHNALALVALALLVIGGASCRPLTYDTPAPQEIETSLFLIGDAGEPDPREVGAPLDSLTAQAAVAPQRSVIVFLGDNVYEEGIPEDGRAEYADARRRLEAQVHAVPPGVRAIFIPGNHDWGREGPYGLFSIRRQERMIDTLAGESDIRLLPGNGCPGPVSIDVGRLRLVMLDTQWWLHDYIVRDAASRCTSLTIGNVTSALRQQVKAPGSGRVVVVAGHHPLMTGGEHGSYCGVTGPFRRFAGRSQDILGGANRRMRDSIESAFREIPPLVYAAGHDHSLQVLRTGRNAPYVLVSGAGSAPKASCAVRLRESLYTSPHRSGFMRLDIMRGGGVLLRVFRFTSSGSGGIAYSHWLEPRP
ncbi:MAG TPA: metallophosphoesterase [Gemmatimonadaceae bacterium]